MASASRVAVLMGGISPEHPVSLVSGCGILANLDSERWSGFPVLISRENEWMWPKDFSTPIEPFTPALAESVFKETPSNWMRIQFPLFHQFPKADIFFIGLHGVGGEDGRLQGLLEMAQQPFTGSGSLGSAIAMDKILSKQLYQQMGIPTAISMEFLTHEFNNSLAYQVEQKIGWPAVVKDPTGGSSLGVLMAKNQAELMHAVLEIGKSSKRILVEMFLSGRELTCGVLDGATVLSPTEIRAKNDAFFNFEAKYELGRAEEITPAPIPQEITKEIQHLALRCHKALRLSVYSRTDFIWTKQGLFALETNNLPGFTPNSLLPQAAAYVGIGYRALLSHILDESLKRWHAP